ncbi:MAG: cation:proton antiporter [Candidatus Thermoplasmatota archaeon]|nr:cation:proton antiporter [Candidatus Thermoplasmatota archaeon]
MLILLGRGLGLLFLRFGIQSMIGEVLAGVLFGILLVLSGQTIVPQTLEAFSDLGILMLLLLAGLMTDFRLFSMYKKESIIIGTGGFIASFAIAFVPILVINQSNIGMDPGTALASALFIAVVLSNTAIEVCAKLFMHGGKQDRVTTSIMGASLVDDIIALFLIGVVSSAVLTGKPLSLEELAFLAFKVTLFLLFCFFVVSFLVQKILDRFITSFLKQEKMQLSITILLAFGLALLAKPFGLHEVIGAYIAGLIIGKWGGKVGPMLKRRLIWEKLIHDIDPPLRAIFSPLFFGYVGLIFIQLLAPVGMSPAIIVLATTLVLLALAGKYVGCGGSAIALGFTKKESLVIGSGMMGRGGALDLALLLFGLQAGILTVEQFSAVVLATMATIILTPILYSWSRRRASRADEEM